MADQQDTAPFRATHVIQLAMKRLYVHAEPGDAPGSLILYTEQEWEDCESADWELDPERGLLFQGRVPDAEYSWHRFETCERTGTDGWNDDGTRASAAKRCECVCGCQAVATTVDDGGNDVCVACSDYVIDEDGETHCSREHDGVTCPHCQGKIQWGSIQTHGPGQPNDQEGRCLCGTWRTADHGGHWTVPGYQRAGA